MNVYEGDIFSGEFDKAEKEFVLKRVKNFQTQSILKEGQLDALYDYLTRASHYDQSHVITINDQLPVRLSNDEVKVVLAELDKIREGLKH